MSDLQCPARVILIPEPHGASWADAIAEVSAALSAERPISVYAPARLVGAAEIVADLIGVEPVVDGDLDREADGLRSAIDALADRHRGEAVVVLGAATVGLAELPGAVRGGVLVSIDADGWRAARWPV